MKNLFTHCMIIMSLILTSCTDSIRSQFESCYQGKLSPLELLQTSKVKKYITQNYSQQYYEKLLSCSKIYSPVYYDSITNVYHLYAWKESKFEDKNTIRLRYYVTRDSIATNLYINDLEIDKTGFIDYAPDCLNNAEQNIESITKLANQGYATAQMILGLYYSEGNGVEQDKLKALQLIGKAAMQKLSDAQSVMGICEDDIEKGIKWLEQAAEQDNDVALISLATLYAEGKHIKQDYSRSLNLYKQAARFNISAQYLLGNIYWDSKIVKTDKEKAIQYFKMAAENNNLKAQMTLGILYMNGDGINKDYAQSLHWLTKAAEQGDADAQFLLARIYMQDDIELVFNDYPSMETIKEMTSKNIEEGVKWLRKSAEQDNLSAQRSLGAYYYKENNLEEARKWLHKAAEQGDNTWLIFSGIY